MLARFLITTSVGSLVTPAEFISVEIVPPSGARGRRQFVASFASSMRATGRGPGLLIGLGLRAGRRRAI